MHFGKITLNRLFCKNIMYFYAVACGRTVGIYNTWSECEQQVKGFKGAKYKKFPTKVEAAQFISQYKIKSVEKSIDKSLCTTENSKKDSWPLNYCNDDNDTVESDLLTALDEVEGVQVSKKMRKHVTSAINVSEPNAKKYKHCSEVQIPIAIKNIRGFDFQIDVDGYIIVYTDGSCFNNGQKNACAGYGVYFGDGHPLNVGTAVTGRVTNNVGEIQATIYAIKTLKDLGISKISISTDSQFLINSVTQWMKSWKAKNWRLKSGGPVKNMDEFVQLDKLLEGNDIKVKWNYVKAHQGIKGNEMADKLAREGSEIYKRIHQNKK